ncbi:hypothetical protein RND71_026793 [Anisodus tanguticus]|uniref:phosphopantothenoylcysteine decarboxylase n=1 Tax=Anisodus tanguticus TaxID=243964 RepID=A0AAE1RLI2_9SOLA|nr:hypothetical protein RND71_026793 [Anisodus tanguticus]
MEPINSEVEPVQVSNVSRKPRILLAASGSVAAVKFANICHCFSEWAEVKAVATKASLNFIDKVSFPKDVLYTDDDEWSTRKKVGDSVLHIELRRWADIMVIAPLSANTLGMIAGGLCDNLLTCIVAPAMNTFMWNYPFTERHLMTIDEYLSYTTSTKKASLWRLWKWGDGGAFSHLLNYKTLLKVTIGWQHHVLISGS